jgi:hypothetical protein
VSVGLTARAELRRWLHGWPATQAAKRCSGPSDTDLAPVSLWLGRAGAAGQGCGSLSGRITDRLARALGIGATLASGSRARRTQYPGDMNESSSRSLGRTVVAGLVLLIAAWLLLHFVIGIVTAIASVLVVVLAIVAIIWALRILL